MGGAVNFLEVIEWGILSLRDTTTRPSRVMVQGCNGRVVPTWNCKIERCDHCGERCDWTRLKDVKGMPLNLYRTAGTGHPGRHGAFQIVPRQPKVDVRLTASIGRNRPGADVVN